MADIFPCSILYALFDQRYGGAADVAALKAGQTAGVVAYATLAELNADLDHPENTPALVMADPVPANNTFWLKVGAAGSGSWSKSDWVFPDVVYAHTYSTLAAADAAAVALGKQLVISTVWSIPVAATLNAKVKVMPGGGFDCPGALNINGSFEAGKYQVFFNYGPVSILGLKKDCPEMFGAKADWNGTTGTDSGPAFNAALSALNKGGVFDADAGRYYSAEKIANADVPIRIQGAGNCGTTDITVGTSVTFAAGVSGWDVWGVGTEMSGIALISLDNGAAGSAVGLTVKRSKQEFRKVSVHKFGAHGWLIDSVAAGGANLNTPRIDNCMSYSNGGDGYHINGSNANAGVFTLLNATANLGTQIYCKSSRNHFLGCHIDSSGVGTRAVYDDSTSNNWNVYVEASAGTGSDFEIGSASSLGVLEALFYAAPNVVGNAAAMSSWRIYERYSYRQFVLADRNGGYLEGKQWKFLNGVSSSGTFQLQVSDPDGSSAVDALKMTGDGGRLITSAHIEPSGNGAKDIGTVNNKWRKGIFSDDVSVNGATWSTGTGSPEGAVTAIVGSLYSRLDGGATTTLYVKTSGAGNTGWTAK